MNRPSDESIEKRMQELRELGERFAKAQADKVYLDEFKKSKLAILMKAAETLGHKTTTAQEREARAHPDYITLLEGLKEATEIAEGARWKFEVAKLSVSVWQTNEAGRRAEKQGYGARS